MSKLNCVISCPISTYSVYGGRSRDFVRAVTETMTDWDVKILPQRWGNTRQNFLEDSNDNFFTPKLISSLTYKPDIWMQITVPNEFQAIGRYNIGITAGIETNICDPTWIQGCNKMDLVLASSNHAKKVFVDTVYEVQDNATKQITGNISLQKPVEVLFEGIDTDTYFKKEDSNLSVNLDMVEENFLFLCVGHWMQGSFGNDRKNIAYTVKSFLSTFKNVSNPPALVLKTLQATSSITDRNQLVEKINNLRRSVKGKLPNIYLLHGELSDTEMNDLYNHSKIKCLISLTKGEGYGRPIAEFACIDKPVMVSNWSGHLDFLDENLSILVNGKLENVHESAVVKNMILKEGQWFRPDDEDVNRKFKSIFKEYNNYLGKSAQQGKLIRENFSYSKMKNKLKDIFSKYVPDLPQQIQLDLSSLQLPKLKKIK